MMGILMHSIYWALFIVLVAFFAFLIINAVKIIAGIAILVIMAAKRSTQDSNNKIPSPHHLRLEHASDDSYVLKRYKK